MKTIRFLFALWISKCVWLGLRIMGRNATYLPGVIALRMDPNFLYNIKKPVKVVAVTGTNGKTTVCNLLTDVLSAQGLKVLNNRLGSNVASGIASSLLRCAGPFGGVRHDIAIWECDERSAHRIFPAVTPDLLVVTNLFRDSIMRNAHPEYIAGILTSNTPSTTKLVLNGDDLLSCSVSPDNQRVYFGISKMESDVTECVNLINDMQVCPHCLGTLEYEYRRYHHIGRARCPDCGFTSPLCDYIGDYTGNGELKVTDTSGLFSYRAISDSIFNVYNMLTAIAVLRELGYSHDSISAKLSECTITASRYNEDTSGGVSIIMQMAKDRNALACSRAFDYVRSKPGKKELILMMNNLHDHKNWSENVCWLYDCDFEFLADNNITRIVATGPRARDYYLRLLHAGVSEEKLRCTLRELDAPALLNLDPGTGVYIFYGTDAIALGYKVKDAVKHLAGRQKS